MEQELGNGWADGVHPDDLRQCLEIYTSAFERREPFEMEYRLRHHSGNYRWVLDRGVPVYGTGGNFLGYIGGCIDIHDRNLAEEALRKSREELRTLASHLHAAREDERTVLAREIHDELGGSLTALKMDLSLLPDRLAADHNLFLEKLNSMSQLIDTILAQVRAIATGLRPVALDELGLVAAVEWQAREFQTRSGIACEVHVPDEDIPLQRDRATAVFRILQEALANVARHAYASKVVLDLGSDGNHVTLMVRDDGKGIAASKIFERGSIGLLGMRERAMAFGGTLDINALPMRGTRVTVRIPTG
jgi:signal transduction histidine kinase